MCKGRGGRWLQSGAWDHNISVFSDPMRVGIHMAGTVAHSEISEVRNNMTGWLCIKRQTGKGRTTRKRL